MSSLNSNLCVKLLVWKISAASKRKYEPGYPLCFSWLATSESLKRWLLPPRGQDIRQQQMGSQVDRLLATAVYTVQR